MAAPRTSFNASPSMPLLFPISSSQEIIPS